MTINLKNYYGINCTNSCPYLITNRTYTNHIIQYCEIIYNLPITANTKGELQRYISEKCSKGKCPMGIYPLKEIDLGTVYTYKLNQYVENPYYYCSHCGTKIITNLIKDKITGLYFCSEKCRKESKKRFKNLNRNRNGLSNNTKKEILEQYHHKCAICGSSEDLEIHHIKPLIEGGDNSKENLIVLCHKCHVNTHLDMWHGDIPRITGVKRRI